MYTHVCRTNIVALRNEEWLAFKYEINRLHEKFFLWCVDSVGYCEKVGQAELSENHNRSSCCYEFTFKEIHLCYDENYMLSYGSINDYPMSAREFLKLSSITELWYSYYNNNNVDEKEVL